MAAASGARFRGAVVACERMASRGYGEGGYTWSFDKVEGVGLKKKKGRARESVREFYGGGDGDVEIKQEMSDEDGIWGDAASAGWGGMGQSASSGQAEDA